MQGLRMELEDPLQVGNWVVPRQRAVQRLLVSPTINLPSSGNPTKHRCLREPNSVLIGSRWRAKQQAMLVAYLLEPGGLILQNRCTRPVPLQFPTREACMQNNLPWHLVLPKTCPKREVGRWWRAAQQGVEPSDSSKLHVSALRVTNSIQDIRTRPSGRMLLSNPLATVCIAESTLLRSFMESSRQNRFGDAAGAAQSQAVLTSPTLPKPLILCTVPDSWRILAFCLLLSGKILLAS